MDDAVLATITANIENNFNDNDGSKKLSEQNAGYEYSVDFQVEGSSQTHHYELEILDKMEFRNNDGTITKAIAFRDQDGNIYVHYNGTGDGNWGYNAVAYEGGPSDVQTESLDFFNDVMRKYGADGHDVYVTGHSQGGNNAQYVLMNSEYGQYIDMCMAMDAPGFSEEAVQNMKDFRGEDYYEAQRQKIYSYNGESDYVDVLGDVIIAPQDKEHLTIIRTPSNNMMDWHMISGMMDGNNLNPTVDDYSSFHYFVEGLSKKICDLPADQQEKIANIGMLVAEYLVGNEKNWYGNLTEEDLADLLKLVVPVLAEYIEENPELTSEALQMLGLTPEMAEVVETLILELNELSPQQRATIFDEIVDCITINGDGSISIKEDLGSVLWAAFNALPAIMETIIDNPAEIYKILEQTGLLDKIEEAVKEHPAISALIGGFILFNLDKILLLAGGLIMASYILDFVRKMVDQMKKWCEEVKNFFVNAFDAIKKTIEKLMAKLRSLTPGGRYVDDNPYFKADPEKLKNYATRLDRVNQRLVQLDKDLDSLYWQVGLVDLGEIASANLITSYSTNLLLAKSFLNKAAEKLEAAERKAKGYMGG